MNFFGCILPESVPVQQGLETKTCNSGGKTALPEIIEKAAKGNIYGKLISIEWDREQHKGMEVPRAIFGTVT